MTQLLKQAFDQASQLSPEAQNAIAQMIFNEIKNYQNFRQDIIEMSLEKRRQILFEQAEKMVTYYQENTEWQEIGAGDFIEYDNTTV